MRALACYVALGACARMAPPPKVMPADGIVQCTDSLDAPVTATVVSAVAFGAIALLASDQFIVALFESDLWLYYVALVPSIAITSGEVALRGYQSAFACRDAKRRGAELAASTQARRDARAKAGALWKRGAAAARADDCATVRAVDPQIRELDDEFHAVVFSRDVAIARCLADQRRLPSGDHL